jgi:hypothetical protein
MVEDGWLPKTEVNSLYYNTVGGEIMFATEAQASLHSGAVARLVARQAESVGKHELRILEIGANTGAFAHSLVHQLRMLGGSGETGLTRVDYLAVDYARESLEVAVERESVYGRNVRILRPGAGRAAPGPTEPARPTLVALATSPGPPTTNLGFVHAEANQFVAATRERFDFAILNELLDDMPCRVFYADREGRRLELLAHARLDQGCWRIRISSRGLEEEALPGMPPSTLTSCSAESIELVAGISRLLERRGMLLMHDYGFTPPFPRLEPYVPPPRSLPCFARLEFPEGCEEGFPRRFFRVFGNDQHGVVQITNDVNFAEIAAALVQTGTVVTLAHGNAIANDPAFTAFSRGDGVFLSEFGLLEPGDDLPALIARLDREQEGLRERYARERIGGHESLFHDLAYVKD